MLRIAAICAGVSLADVIVHVCPIIQRRDKLLPLMAVTVGIITGYLTRYMKSPFFCSLWYLTPSIQGSSVLSRPMSSTRDLDRGIIVWGSSSGISSFFGLLVAEFRWVLLGSFLIIVSVGI